MRAPTHKELREMIGQAMRDRAPAMYAELQSKGLLDGVLDDRANQARESASEGYGEPHYKILSHPSQDIRETAARLDQAKSRAWEVALSQATEFQPETT